MEYQCNACERKSDILGYGVGEDKPCSCGGTLKPLKAQTAPVADVPYNDRLVAPDGARRFDCGGEIEMIDSDENTIRVKPMISVAGLKAGDYCNLILYKYQRGN
jgi:hypothetical protein